MVKVVNPMNDPKKKKQTDSTTDFFLQFVKEEKSEKEKRIVGLPERERSGVLQKASLRYHVWLYQSSWKNRKKGIHWRI